MQKWRAALEEVGNISIWDVDDDRHESIVVEDISRKILSGWSRYFSNVSNVLFGIESRVEEMMRLLSIGLNDVRILGIYGMGGIGKTTLSKVIYERVSHQFEASCFISGIREETRSSHGLLYLQKQLISEILMEREINIWNEYGASRVIANRLRNKKVLIVLDDVDGVKQLEALAWSQDWFGQGSRIIITSRDHHLLDKFVNNTYELKVLNDAEALRLFSWKAFKKLHPEENYVKLSMDFVNYAKGLPLALEVFGSYLFARNVDAWESARDFLKENPNTEILDKLKISFDGLEDLEKKLFLDISCFFNGANINSIRHKLESFGYYLNINIKVLVDKSLLTISPDRDIRMHDLLQKMGQKIVHDESEEPGGRSRLCHDKDVIRVLKNDTGTDAVEGIVLNLPLQKTERLNVEAFSKMKNLKMLEISNNTHLIPNFFKARDNLPTLEWHGDLSNFMLSNELCVMEWLAYPLESLPTSFQSDNLVELIIRYSSVKQLWDGWKSFGKLKRIVLSDSKNLIETPDFSRVPNLEDLMLDYCTSLSKLHPSIGFLRRLKRLNLQGCKRIKRLPDEIYLESIQYLNLYGCSRLNKFPESVGNMTSLRWLYLARTAIKKLPLSLKSLSSLVSLDISGCSRLKKIPKNLISGMKCLQYLLVAGSATRKFPLDLISLLIPNSFSGLSSLTHLDLSHHNLSDGAIPSDFCCLSSLKDLILSGNKFTRIPVSAWQLSSLRRLDLSYCNLLDGAIPNDLSCLSSLGDLNLSGNKFTRIPESAWQLSSLKVLDLSYCNLLDGATPNDLSCLSSLRILKLSGNKFTRIPDSVAQLSRLWTLHLEDCIWLQVLPKLPLGLQFLGVKNCPSLELLYNQMDIDCSFVAAYIDYGQVDYKILHLHPRNPLWTEEESTTFIPMIACGPALGSGIPGWFNDKSRTNSFGTIQMLTDLDLGYGKWKGYALFIVYQVLEPDTYPRKRRKRKRKVHEHGNSNSNSRTFDGNNPSFPYFLCQFQANEVDLGEPLVLCAPGVPSVGLSGFWLYIPAQWFRKRASNSLGGWSSLNATSITKASITTGSLNVEVKECGARVVRRYTSEFYQVLNSISPSGLDFGKIFLDLNFGLSLNIFGLPIGSIDGHNLSYKKKKKKIQRSKI